MITDEEYVERMRKQQSHLKTMRRVMIVLYSVLVLALIGIAIATSILFQNLQQGLNLNGLGPGYLIGAAFGSSFGFLAVHVIHNLFYYMFFPDRSIVLMLRYHDELAALKGQPGPTGPGCSHPGDA